MAGGERGCLWGGSGNRRGGLCERGWGMGEAALLEAGRERLVSHCADEQVVD